MNNIIILILGNWIFLAMFGISILLIVRFWMSSYYDRLFNGFSMKKSYVLLAFSGILIIIWREILIVPYYVMDSWLPGSSTLTQFVYWLYSTHLLSILIVGGFIFIMWKKFDRFLPALYVGWLALGLIEISFIPQHLLMINQFVGLYWYAPFIGLMVPFLLDIKKFSYNKKGLLFIGLGILVQYFIILLYPWSLSIYDPGLMSFGINYKFFPDPPVLSWIFMELNHVLKIAYLVALSYITFGDKKNE